MARPRLNIDPIEVEKLAAMGCSNREIAAFFDCDEAVIRKRFSAECDKGREKGKSKLRRLMWQSAERGSHVMQIWLSKQILGYAEKQEIEHTGKDGSPLFSNKEFADYVKALKENK